MLNIKVVTTPVMKRVLSFLFFGLSVSLMNAQESVQINSSFENGQKGFELNKGYFYDQDGNSNPKVRYIYQHEDLKVHVRNNGFSYESYRKSDSKVNIHRIDFNFINATRGAFKETGLKHFRNIRVFYKDNEYYKSLCQKIIQKNVWEGVDIEYIINQETGDFKYNFIVSNPEALNKIGLSINGQEDAYIANGALILSTTNGEIKEVIPESFDANNHNIEVNWILENNKLHFAEQGEVEYPITIDPMPYRIWGRYIGGQYADAIRSIDVDTAGNVVFCGYTSSTGLATSGTYQTSMSSTVQTGVDAWVGKTTRSGYLIWASYFGGTRDDRFTRVTQTTDNNFVVVGSTFSTNFPKKNAFQTSQGGKLDAVIVKFSDSGSLLWSTYYGSSGTDDLVGIVSDPSGNIYASGYTTSSSGVTSGGSSVWKRSRASSTNTDEEGWLVKINGSGSRQWSTLIGSYDGSDILTDVGYDIQNDRVLVGGFTNSNSKSGRDKLNHNFSSSGGTSYNGGVSDGFVASFGNNGSLNWSRYFGDTGLDETVALVCDTGGVFYAVGNTGSGTNIASSGGFQITYGGNTDGWLAKFNKNGIIEWSSYIGGTLSDLVWDLDMDTFNYLYLIGITESFYDDACGCVDTNAIYTSASYQEDVEGGYDAFIQKFDKSGDRLWSTFYGGRGNEGGVTAPEDYMGIATGIQDDVFVGGFTASRRSGTLDSDTFPGKSNGADDGFLARFNQCDSFIRANWVEPTCHYDTLQFLSYDKDSNTVLNNMRYEWTGPSNFTSDVQNPFIPNADRNKHDGDYQLIAIDSTGCRDTVNLEVKLKYVIFFNNPDTITLCVGDSLTLGGIRAYDDGLDFSFVTTTYEWTGPDSFSANAREPFVTSSSTKLNRGMYHLKATTVEGCWDTTFVFLNIGFADTIRAVDTACLYSSAKLRIDDISKYSSYKWKKPDGSIINDSIIDIAAVQHVDTGFYYIYLEKTNGCKDTIQTKLSLALDISSDFDITDASQCLSGNRFEFFYDSSTNIGKVDSLFWLSTDSLSGYQKSSAIDSWSRSYSSAGAYNIRLISKSDRGCFDTTLKTINVRPTPSVDFTINSDSQCLNGNSFTLVNTSTISVGRLDSISWVFGDGNNLELGRLNSNLLPLFSNTTTKTYDSAGTYTIDFYAFSSFGCVDSLSKTIGVWPKNNTSITVAADSQCVDPNLYEFTNYDTLSSGSITNRRWTFGDNSFTNPALNVSNPTKSYSDSGAYTVTYITTTNNGCFDTAITQVYVYFNNHISIDSTVILDVLCQTDSLGNIYSHVSGGNGSLSYKWYDSDTVLKSSMENLLGVKEGAYYLEITDSLNCVVSSALDTIISLSKINIENLSFIEPKCFNDSNAQITVDVSGGVGTLKYFWINNSDTLARTEDISNVWAETFVLVVEDDSLCRYSDTIDVTQPEVVRIDSSFIDSTNCYAGSDGSIELFVLGGRGAYSYAWYEGASIDSLNQIHSLITSKATGLDSGFYTVLISDTNNCQLTDVFTVLEPAVLDISITTIDSANCASSGDGWIATTSTGGTKPYSYSWSNGQTTDSAFNLIAGSYEVMITDYYSCLDSVSGVVYEPLKVSIDSTFIDSANCFQISDGFAEVFTSGGTGSYDYLWQDGQTTKKAISLKAGNYKVIVTDQYNCNDSIVVSVHEPPKVTISILKVDSANCFSYSDGSILTSTTGGTGVINYQWSDGQTDTVATNLSAGTYKLVSTDAYGCKDSISQNLPEPDSILVTSIDIKHVTCRSYNDAVVTVNAVGGNYLYYSIDSGNTYQSSNRFDSLAPGDYYVMVKDIYGCAVRYGVAQSISTVESNTILRYDSLEITHVDCKSNSTGKAELSVKGGTKPYSYKWNRLSTSALVSTNEDLLNTIAGTYSFYVVDSFLCEVVIDTITITEPDKLEASLLSTLNVDCYGNSTAEAVAQVVGGTTPYVFSWLDNSGNQKSVKDSLQMIPKGTYNFFVTDSLNCMDSVKNVSITEPDSLYITNIIVDSVNCYDGLDGSINVDIVGGTKNYNFEWTDNTGNVVSNQEDLSGVGIGNYRLSIMDKNSCVDTSATIRVDQPDSIRIYDISQVDADCYSNQTGSIDVKVDGGVLPYSFQWKNSKASNISNSQNLTNAGKEKYYLIVTDYYSCQEQTALIEIDEPDRLVASIDSFLNVDCKSNSTGKITTDIVGGNGGNQYLWINNLSDTITKQQNLYDAFAGTYHFYVTDSLGCMDSLKSKVITEPDTLIIKNIAITNVDCYGNNTGSVQVDVSGGTTAYSFQWTDSAGSIVQSNEDLSNVVLGRYALKVTDKQGCIDTIQDVVITQPDSLDIYNIVKENVDCYGNSTGDLFVDISGGTKAYNYEWIKVNNSSVVSTLEDLRNVPIGVYTLTVTDKNFCQKTFTDTITQPDLFKFDDFKVKGVTCYGDTTGAIYTTLIGGSSPFKHVWQKLNKDTIGNAKNLINVPVGYYYTTVEDDSGCVITSNNIFVEAPATPLSIWGLVTTDLTCYGDSNGTADYSVYGGTPSYKYYWKLDTQLISTSKTLTNAKAGSYTLIVEDDSLCTNVIPNVLIKEPGEVFIDTTLITNPSCEYSSDGSIQLLGKGGNRIYQYSIDSGKNYQSSQIFSNLDTGVYYVQLTDSNQCISPIFKRTLVNGDKTKPVVRSNDLNIYLDSNGSAQIALDSLDDMSFDNCEIDTMYSSVNEVDCGDMPLINGYLYAIDKNGNMDSSLFKLTIYDTIKPVFAVVDTVYVYLDSNGNGSFDNTDILLSASDNCGIKDTLYSQNTYTCQNVGENIETTTISDIHMNSSSLSTIVIVSDTIAPVLDVEDIILYLDTNGEALCEFSSFDRGSYDECTIDSVGLDKMKFTCADTGNNLVNVWAIDPSGNESRTTVNARVLDSISPKFDIKSIVVTLDYSGKQSISKGDLVYNVWDNCGIYDTTYSKYDFDLNDSGDLFIDVYVSDIHGNTTGPKQVKVTVLWGDADRDSIPDHIEGDSDFDGDGIPNYLDLDSDNDGILDVEENEGQKYLLDKDGDGKPNVWDLDSDGDGIDDVIEADGDDPDFDGVVGSGTPDVDKNGVPDLASGGYDPSDTDNDGDKDYKDLDTDDDGIPDEVEKGSTKDPIDTDSDGVRDWRSKDSDSDGIPDYVEAGDDPAKPVDSDGDGVPDYLDLDSDNDGITDNFEKGMDGENPVDTDKDGIPDYLDLDSDDDGIPDLIEGDNGGDNPTDTDGDGIPDFIDIDSDDDGIFDEFEKGADGNNPDDLDADGIPSYRDLDSDDDGIPDVVEGDQKGNNPTDTDGDGIPDFWDLDSDNDKIPDQYEKGADGNNPDDTDNDGKDDYRDTDSDNDGIEDDIEAGDDPENPVDTDNDGVEDYKDRDSDDDGISDDIEKGGLGKDKPSDSDNDGIPDYLDLDSDNDGITDNYEKGEDGDDPEDTDGDNIPDYLDVDSDNDGIPDVVEGDKGGDNPTDTDGDGIPDFRDLDSDDDGISDEYEKGKDGNNPDNSDDDVIPDYRDIDSDNDGLSDTLEAGDDPDNPDDTDGDGLDDYKDEDSDNDGWSDGDEAGDDKENPLDSDGDGIYNFREKDSDDDEIPDSEEDNLEKTRIPDITIPEGISINNDGLNDILYIKGLRNFKNTSILIFNRWGQLVYESGLGYSNDNPFEGKYQGGSFTFRQGEYLPEGVYFLVFKSNDYRNLNIRQSLYIKK